MEAMVAGKHTPKGMPRVEPIILDQFRHFRNLLSDQRIKERRRRYPLGDLLPCDPETVIIILMGTVMLRKTVHTNYGSRHEDVRSYGPQRIPNVGALKSMGFAGDGFQLVAESDVLVLEFDNRADVDLLQMLAPLVQDVLIAQQGEDLGQALYFIERDAREATEKEAELARQLEEVQQEQGEKLVEVRQELDRTNANLRSVTENLERAQGTIGQLRDINERLIREREEANTAAASARDQMREALKAFDEERQQTSDFWKRFERFMQEMGLNRLPQAVANLLLGFSEDEVEASLSSSLGEQDVPELEVTSTEEVIDEDEDAIVIDTADLEEILEPSTVREGSRNQTAAFPLISSPPRIVVSEDQPRSRRNDPLRGTLSFESADIQRTPPKK
jgi:hypothetical protein